MKKIIYSLFIVSIILSACEEKPELAVEGCMDETSCNFNDEADIQLENSCVFAIPGYNCDNEKLGCMDQNACNYDENAQANDGSCIFAEEGYNCDGQLLGCMDEIACNYNEDAEFEDGTCVYPPPGQDCSGLLYGCTDDAYLEYYTQGFVADLDDGSCQTTAIFGCMDQSFCSWNQFANIDVPSDCNGLPGCMDQTSCNYNPSADCPDGSCYGLSGCMDVLAVNFNSSATCDDGSCSYTCQSLLDGGLTPSQILNGAFSIGLSDLYGCTYQGGLIFHFDNSLNKGLVISQDSIGNHYIGSNLNTGQTYTWVTYFGYPTSGSNYTFGTFIDVFQGSYNTNLIQTNSSSGSLSNPGTDGAGTLYYQFTAKVGVFNNSGYNDWFIPSINELYEVYDNLVTPGKIYYGDFQHVSSSESGPSTFYTLQMGPDNGSGHVPGQYYEKGKFGYIYVGPFKIYPVREF